MTVVSDFQPTFLQKLLGRNYKWWYLFQFRFKSRTVSIIDNYFFVFGHLMVLLGTILTWWLANNKIVDYELQQKWTYFIIGEIYFNFIYTFAEYLAFEFVEGRHTKDLLRPQKYIWMKMVDAYGEASVQNTVKFVLLAIVILLLQTTGTVNFNFNNFFILLGLIPLSFVIFYFVAFTVACSGFFLPRIHGIAFNFTFVSALLMGRVFPLNLLTSNFAFYLFDPLAFTFYHPMQIYLGKYDTIQTIWVFMGGIAWCVVLYFLAKLVFKLGLKRNESVGL